MLESLFNKIADLGLAFSCEDAKFLRIPILKNVCERLLLIFHEGLVTNLVTSFYSSF